MAECEHDWMPLPSPKGVAAPEWMCSRCPAMKRHLRRVGMQGAGVDVEIREYGRIVSVETV